MGGITESEYNEYMREVDMEQLDDMDEEFLKDRYPMAMESQLTAFSKEQSEFEPNWYLAKVELYQMYLENDSDNADNESSDAESPSTPQPSTTTTDEREKADVVNENEDISPTQQLQKETE